MTNEEINKTIHEKVMNECWHEMKGGRIRPAKCIKSCGLIVPIAVFQQIGQSGINPDYCSDLNAVHRAEMKAIERLSTTNKNPNVAYCRHLMVANGFNYDDLGYLYEQVIRASARQRAEAVLRATGNWVDTKEGTDA